MAETLINAAHAQEAKRVVVEIKIKNGRVVAPKGAVRVTENETVELRWTSDRRVQVHIHGYDRKLEVGPGKAAKMTIRARVTGRFPITSHGGGGHGHDTLTYLEVYPR